MKLKPQHLITVSVLILLVFLYSAFNRNDLTRKMQKLRVTENIGMNSELMSLVESLENEIKNRNEYELILKSDPLKLTKILTHSSQKLKANFDAAENRDDIRLSCTIVSADKAIAIVKYRGKSFNVLVGDTLSGRVVTAIDKKKLVFDYQGKSQTLYNEKAAKGELTYRKQELEHSDL